MRPTVFFARADGIHLRPLYLFASAGQACSTGIAGSRISLIKGDGPTAAPWPLPLGRGMEKWDAHNTPPAHRYCCYDCSGCCRCGTRPARCHDCCSTTRPAGAPPITPRLAPRRHHTPDRGKIRLRRTAQWGLALRACASRTDPNSVQKNLKERGDAHNTPPAHRYRRYDSPGSRRRGTRPARRHES